MSKKTVRSLLHSCLSPFFVFVGFFLVFSVVTLALPTQVEAQGACGSNIVKCCRRNEQVNLPDGCTPECDPDNPYCTQCTSSEWRCAAETREQCGFQEVFEGCEHACLLYIVSGSCSASSPSCTESSSWGAWSACSLACGGGTMTRYNTCSGTTQTMACNLQACPTPTPTPLPTPTPTGFIPTPTPTCVHTTWGGWGACNTTCGTGTQYRYDNCGVRDSQSCTNTNNCCTWGSWGGCSTCCGTGTKYRTDSCNNSESASCTLSTCCSSCDANAWSAWSACSKSCNGTQSRTNACGVTESQTCNVNLNGCVPAVTTTTTQPNCSAFNLTQSGSTVTVEAVAHGGDVVYEIPNPSFEEGNYNFWTTQNDLNLFNVFNCLSDPSFNCSEGSWFLAFKRDPANTNGGYLDPYFASEWFETGISDLSGKTFTFRFTARGEFVSYDIPTIGLQTRPEGDDWTNGTSVYASLPTITVLPQIWQNYEYTVTFPSATAGYSTSQMRIVLRTPNNDYTAYYDGIDLTNMSVVQNLRVFYTPFQSGPTADYCTASIWTELTDKIYYGPPDTELQHWYANWDISSLPAGNKYYVVANITDSNGVSCTGNPSGTCNVPGFTSQCTVCRQVYTVCQPSCTPACGQSNGCGGTCSNTDAGAPTAPTITSPANGSNVSMTSSTIIVNFTQSSTARTNQYEIVLFNKGFYDSIINAPDGGIDVNGDGTINYDDLKAYAIAYPEDERVKYSQQTGNYYQTPGSYSDSFWMTANVDMNRNLVAAVRAVNTTCSTQPSAWAVSEFNLVGSVTGGLYEVTSVNDCSTTSKPATMTLPSVVSITDTFGVNHGINNWLVAYNLFRIINLPYAPDNSWPATWSSARLAINNDPAHPENTYICATCNRNPVGTVLDCVYPPQGGGTTTVPMSGANFFLISYNLSNGPWWQTWGGLVLANGGMSSLGPTDTISNQTCLRNTQCDPSIIQTSSGPSGNTGPTNSDPASNETAGIPIVTGTNTITGGKSPGSYFSRRAGNARVTASTTGHSQANVKVENYAYFANTTALSVPLTSNGSSTSISRLDQLTGIPLNIGSNEVGYTVPGDLNISITQTADKWNVTGGTKAVIFVPGNLTISTSLSADSAADMSQLINVDEGSFLGFIVKGDITIAANLGYNGDKTTIAGFTTPILEGVYLATGTFRVASFAASTPSDYKFVGAGTFVGLAGVDLQRDFEDAATRKELHNTSPTEVFQFRPDFLVNTPDVLRRPIVQWKEVN